MKKLSTYLICGLLLASIVLAFTSCKPRDCKGRKKTAKTQMGGWL
ncbi:MAG TPA: hypothetical protein VF411_15415 [Bacteroidia bacterium]